MSIKIDMTAKVVSHKRVREKELVDKLRKGLWRAVALVERQAKEDCPVDTGRLRGSITSSVMGSEGKVGTKVDYASPVEFGTVNRPATPFLFPALEKNRQRIIECLK